MYVWIESPHDGRYIAAGMIGRDEIRLYDHSDPDHPGLVHIWAFGEETDQPPYIEGRLEWDTPEEGIAAVERERKRRAAA